MSKADYKSAFLGVLSNYVRHTFGIESESREARVDWDWEITEEEANNVMRTKDYFNIEYDDVIRNHYHIDSISKRLIAVAYIVFNDSEAFEKVDDALYWINKKGHNFKCWQEVEDAAERKEILDCWHSQEGFMEDGSCHAERLEAINAEKGK